MMKSNESIRKQPKISIGLPVYNGEFFLHKKMESLLSQTFRDFELIISDNGSTDATSTICQEYAKKDQRIRYYRQEKNMGPKFNYEFVLQEAICDYFVWTAVDDIMMPEFLEKNYNALESDKSIIASISRVKRYGAKVDMFIPDPNDPKFRKIYKKIRRHFRKYGAVPLHGTYEQKVRTFLRSSSGQNFYAVFRTEKLREGWSHIYLPVVEFSVIVPILKYGDIHVLDDVLLYCYDSGISSASFIESLKSHRINLKQFLCPSYHYIVWCKKYLGIKFVLKNLDQFILWNCGIMIATCIEIFQMFKQKILKNTTP